MKHLKNESKKNTERQIKIDMFYTNGLQGSRKYMKRLPFHVLLTLAQHIFSQVAPCMQYCSYIFSL